MATHETYFFRDVHPFDVMRSTVIPELLKTSGGGGLNFWSAAASTGQEAYSLAIMMRQYFPQVLNLKIIATDFSSSSLEVAERGRFTQLEVNRGLPAAMLVRYFDRRGRDWHVKGEIRRMVTFSQLNLTHSLAALPKMDLVLLRNVLTYFPVALKSSILIRTATVMKAGAYLFLGGSETTYGLDPTYELVRIGRTVCYKCAELERGKHGQIRY